MDELSKRDRLTSAPEQIILDEIRYKTIATRLFQENRERIEADEDAYGYGATSPENIDGILYQLPRDVLNHYWGHGVTRGDTVHNIAAVISILENHIMLGDASPLGGAGHMPPYTSADFVIISRKDGATLIKGLRETGRAQFILVNSSQGEPLRDPRGNSVRGVKIDLGALVCNRALDSLVEPLREMFPGVKILHASELADYIREQEGGTG